MPLPEAILLHPIQTPVKVRLGVPGSKSITNRALILAALSHGTRTLEGALWSEDTQVMVNCLRKIGFDISILEDSSDEANRRIQVHGSGGRLPSQACLNTPLDLHVGNAGTAARFLLAMTCLGHGQYRLSGVDRMHERPQKELIMALRELGYQIVSENGNLPAIVHGQGPRPGSSCTVSIRESSQFASALLLSAKAGGWDINTPLEQSEHAPYVEMTRSMIEAFPQNEGAACQIEPDASGGSYFWAIKHLMSKYGSNPSENIQITHWPQTDWQIDTEFPKFLPLPPQISREQDLGDSIMTSIVMAPWSSHSTTFSELGRLRVQECERVKALKTELTKCGAQVEEHGDTLKIHPGRLHGASIDTYNDHRMAMCFAVVGTQIPGIVIKNPACVKKTFPNFFQKLASPAPEGLSMKICNASTGELLSPNDLIA
ncbi:3-phosphoshikimate 1-carboxyvinyltransferase [Verrucomicrobia bacterium]|nr:3-phosphoshikimate 1-carboxyvinyltransferase [Verrucomicrobiota bacterium]